MAKLTKKQVTELTEALESYKVQAAQADPDDIDMDLINARNELLTTVAKYISKLTDYSYDTEMWEKRFKGDETAELESSLKLLENNL